MTTPTRELLEHMLDALETPSRELTKWEEDFVQNQRDKVEKWKNWMPTDRVWEILESIYAEKTS